MAAVPKNGEEMESEKEPGPSGAPQDREIRFLCGRFGGYRRGGKGEFGGMIGCRLSGVLARGTPVTHQGPAEARSVAMSRSGLKILVSRLAQGGILTANNEPLQEWMEEDHRELNSYFE